jgi:hypothetical protein
MQSKDAEDDTQAANQQANKDASDLRPAWIRALEVTVTRLHSLMPKVCTSSFVLSPSSLLLSFLFLTLVSAIPKTQAYSTEHQGPNVPLLRERNRHRYYFICYFGNFFSVFDHYLQRCTFVVEGNERLERID